MSAHAWWLLQHVWPAGYARLRRTLLRLVLILAVCLSMFALTGRTFFVAIDSLGPSIAPSLLATCAALCCTWCAKVKSTSLPAAQLREWLTELVEHPLVASLKVHVVEMQSVDGRDAVLRLLQRRAARVPPR